MATARLPRHTPTRPRLSVGATAVNPRDIAHQCPFACLAPRSKICLAMLLDNDIGSFPSDAQDPSISLKWRCGLLSLSLEQSSCLSQLFQEHHDVQRFSASAALATLNFIVTLVPSSHTPNTISTTAMCHQLVLECPQDLCARLVHVAHQQQVNMLELAEARGDSVGLMRSILDDTFAHKLVILEDPEQNVARYFFLTKVRILSFVYVSPISAPSVTGARLLCSYSRLVRASSCVREYRRVYLHLDLHTVDD